jgi:hypothetical protein
VVFRYFRGKEKLSSKSATEKNAGRGFTRRLFFQGAATGANRFFLRCEFSCLFMLLHWARIREFDLPVGHADWNANIQARQFHDTA